MAELEKKTGVTNIKHKGYIDMASMNRAIRGWFLSEYYRFIESKHKYKAAEREIEMTASRKLNEYVKYKIDVRIRAWDLRDVEIIQNGQKIKTQEGKVSIDIVGTMELDWMKRFGGNRFLQALQDFYHKFIIKREIGIVWIDHLDKKIAALRTVIQQQLGFEA